MKLAPETLNEIASALMARHNHTREEFMREARGWLMDCGLIDEDSSWSDASVLRCINRECEGGLSAFAAAF